jgi:hypothetical protein
MRLTTGYPRGETACCSAGHRAHLVWPRDFPSGMANRESRDGLPLERSALALFRTASFAIVSTGARHVAARRRPGIAQARDVAVARRLPRVDPDRRPDRGAVRRRSQPRGWARPRLGAADQVSAIVPVTTTSRGRPDTTTVAVASSVSLPRSSPASSCSRTLSSISRCALTPSFLRNLRTDMLKASSSTLRSPTR